MISPFCCRSLTVEFNPVGRRIFPSHQPGFIRHTDDGSWPENVTNERSGLVSAKI